MLDTGLLTATVPTPGMLNGDFSPADVANRQHNRIRARPRDRSMPRLLRSPAGQHPGAMIDPNMQALMKLYPAPNADPNATGGYNYVQSEIFNQNNSNGRVAATTTSATTQRCSCATTCQRETQQFPVGLWWRQSDQVPYPTPIQGRNRSDSVTGSLTHVFSPTMTNETVFAYTFVGFPNVFRIRPRWTAATSGYNYPGLFKNKRCADSVVRRQWRRGRSGARISIRADLKPAVLPPACMPTNTCPASATR